MFSYGTCLSELDGFDLAIDEVGCEISKTGSSDDSSKIGRLITNFTMKLMILMVGSQDRQHIDFLPSYMCLTFLSNDLSTLDDIRSDIFLDDELSIPSKEEATSSSSTDQASIDSTSQSHSSPQRVHRKQQQQRQPQRVADSNNKTAYVNIIPKVSKPKRTDHLFKSRYRHLDHEKSAIKPELSAAFTSQPMISYIPHGSLPTRESSINMTSFIEKMIRLTNLADSQYMVKLISSGLNDNARVRIRSPLVQLDKVRSMIVVGMNMSLSDLFPDGILALTSFKRYRNSKGLRKIKAKMSFSGTRICKNTIPDMFDEETKLKGSEPMIADEVDDSMDEDIKNEIRRLEIDYAKTGRMITVGYEITVQMLIDDFTLKVGIYDVESHMVTFAGRALHEYRRLDSDAAL
jgi:hypothetical protein